MQSVIVSAIVLLAGSPTFGEHQRASMSQTELKSRLESHFAQYATIEGQWTMTGVWVSGKQRPAGLEYYRGAIDIIRRQPNYRCQIRRTTTNRVRGQLRTEHDAQILFFSGGRWGILNVDPKTLKPLPEGAALWPEDYTGTFPGIDHDFDSILLGRSVCQGKLFTELLFGPNTRITPEVRAGNDCIKVERHTKLGTYTVWLDSKRDFSPAAIVEDLSPDDELDGTKLRDFGEERGGPFEYVRRHIDVTKWSIVDGKSIPSEWTHRNASKQGRTPSEETFHTIKMVALKFRTDVPDDAFSMTKHLQEGARVADFRTPSVAYSVKNGEVAKTFDTEFAAQSFAFEYRPGIAIIGVGAFILAGLTIIVWKWKRRRV